MCMLLTNSMHIPFRYVHVANQQLYFKATYYTTRCERDDEPLQAVLNSAMSCALVTSQVGVSTNDG